jgi:hypothetical protein
MTHTLTAGNILAFEDYTVGTSAIPGALALWGGCGTCTITSDSAQFNALLAGGGWDVAIYAEQNTGTYSSSAAELTTYVSGGGKLIGQTWRQGGLDALLQATFASEDGSVITTDGNPVFAGLGPVIHLSNPGWGIFSQGWNPGAGAVGIGSLNSGGSAIILGNSGRTYLNAGLTDTYSPQSDGERLLSNEIGILTGGAPTPEPSTFVGMGLGLTALIIRRFRR